jgi:divinyl protochlorophyllide a 8-vinyl-reductase
MHGSTEAAVGPNAVTRLAEALAARAPDALAPVFAGHARWLDAPPEAMVFEGDVAALHAALWQGAAAGGGGGGRARGRAADGGLRARPPHSRGVARAVLRMLPAAASAPLLGRAVAAHAWTFAGSGRVRVRNGRPLAVEIAGQPAGRRAGLPVASRGLRAAVRDSRPPRRRRLGKRLLRRRGVRLPLRDRLDDSGCRRRVEPPRLASGAGQRLTAPALRVERAIPGGR